ncbi:MAG: glycosyltransferase [Neomegalonema sp.]|nr:glycosyltransferase [Neomegalonema sp.]
MLIRFMESFFDKIGEPQSRALQEQARKQEALSAFEAEGAMPYIGAYADHAEPEPGFEEFLAWLAKNHGDAVSRQFMEIEHGFSAEREPASLQLAEEYLSAGDRKAALYVLDQALIANPKSRAALKLFVQVAEEQGWLRMIVRKLNDVKRFTPLPTPTEEYRRRLEEALGAFERGLKLSPRETFNYSHAAITAAVSAAHAAGQSRRLLRQKTGKTILMTGSLGPGGAEQQLVRSAIAMHREMQEARVHPDPSTDPLFAAPAQVEVWAESLVRRANGDFFLHRLDREGVPFRVVDRFRRHPVSEDELEKFKALSLLLPKGAFRNFHKLRQAFEASRPDVVMIWQDGTVFTSVLAALWAGVPQIVCAFRGMPPNVRRHRLHREYGVLFRALLGCENVRFSSNSEVVAEHYAHWLGADPARFLVLPNFMENARARIGAAVAVKRKLPGKLARFDELVGGAFRFDVNKNPFTWVDTAKRVAAARPQTGFVMIGDGPLFDAVRTYAEVEGMSDRIHFTGASQSVADWLSQCDAFLHMSKTEGLPNVLMEAQLAGVPVVATDAGGTRETVLNGQTAFLIDLDQDNAALADDAAEHLLMLLADPERRRQMGERAQAFIADYFSRERFLERITAILGEDETRLQEVAVKPKIEFKDGEGEAASTFSGFASPDFGVSIQTFAFEGISSNKLKVGSTARKMAWNPLAPFLIWYALLKSYSGLRPFYREFVIEKLREWRR